MIAACRLIISCQRVTRHTIHGNTYTLNRLNRLIDTYIYYIYIYIVYDVVDNELSIYPLPCFIRGWPNKNPMARLVFPTASRFCHLSIGKKRTGTTTDTRLTYNTRVTFLYILHDLSHIWMFVAFQFFEFLSYQPHPSLQSIALLKVAINWSIVDFPRTWLPWSGIVDKTRALRINFIA